MSRAAAIAAGLLLLIPNAASAQQYELGATAQAASGATGGASGAPPERARTRVRIAVDFRVDEFPKDILAMGMVVEVEPHSSFGLDLRYMRRLNKRFEVNVGAIGFVYPASLIGPSAGAAYHLRLSSAVDFTVGPELNVFVIGTDLPSGTVIWQGLLQAGIHVDL